MNREVIYAYGVGSLNILILGCGKGSIYLAIYYLSKLWILDADQGL